MIAGTEIGNRSCNPDHATFRGSLSFVDYDFIQSTCMQYVTMLSMISLVSYHLKWSRDSDYDLLKVDLLSVYWDLT